MDRIILVKASKLHCDLIRIYTQKAHKHLHSLDPLVTIFFIHLHALQIKFTIKIALQIIRANIYNTILVVEIDGFVS